jgi:hypothetical protein
VKLLQEGLRSSLLENDDKKLRESIQKVISFMILGIDVSELFADMVKVRYFQNQSLISISIELSFHLGSQYPRSREKKDGLLVFV